VTSVPILDRERSVFQIGSALREARERQRLELADVERETRIRARYLVALEEERFELMPAEAYAKGFLRSYADFLGLDGRLFVDEFNSRFPEPEPPQLTPPKERVAARWAPRAPLVLVVVLVAALLGVLAWRFGGAHHSPAASPGPRLTVAPRRPRRAVPSKVLPAPRKAEARIAHLVLRARDRCWVSVRAGSQEGPVLYEGTLSAGDVLRYTLAASRPQLWVRLGAPRNLAATLNGKPISTLRSVPSNIVVTRSSGRLTT
jgi:cytoskeleton protein RodZ